MANRKIAIVTDSTCDLPDSLLQENNILVVPLRIVYAAHEYRDRVDISAERILELLKQEVPKTTLPLTQDVTDIFDRLLSEHYTDVIYLSLASGLSGSYNLIRLLAQQYADINIEVIDTCTVSMGLGFLALEAAREARRTGDPKAVKALIENIRPRMEAVFVIRTLEYLIKGGRIGRVEATLGNLIDIKPIIEFGLDGGVCHTIAKAIGFKNSVQKMLFMIQQKYGGKKVNIAVVHTAAPNEAAALLEEIKRFATVCESYVMHLGPALGIYSGPGLLGIVAYETETI
jgi:DegV family protein with EDD domain